MNHETKNFLRRIIGGAEEARPINPLASEPITPEPNYVCANCGMLVKTGHGHTREECEEYINNPTSPDFRLQTTFGAPSRNQPKAILPYYYPSIRPSSKTEENGDE